jgi:hypothetical protein
MAVITDNTNYPGVEVNLPDTFDGNNENGDRDAEANAASTSYDEDTLSISSAGGGGFWRFWNSFNRMTIVMMLCLFILLGLTASLSATAAKHNVVANMSSITKSSKAPTAKSTKAPALIESKAPTAKSTKAPACSARGESCTSPAECCIGDDLYCVDYTCLPNPFPPACSADGESCKSDADCCGFNDDYFLECVSGTCLESI